MGTQLPPKGAQQLPLFGPRLLWPNGRPSRLLLSTCQPSHILRAVSNFYFTAALWEDDEFGQFYMSKIVWRWRYCVVRAGSDDSDVAQHDSREIDRVNLLIVDGKRPKSRLITLLGRQMSLWYIHATVQPSSSCTSLIPPSPHLYTAAKRSGIFFWSPIETPVTGKEEAIFAQTISTL